MGFLSPFFNSTLPTAVSLSLPRWTDLAGLLRLRLLVATAIALSYGPPWAHYLGGYQDRLLGGPLGLLVLCYTAPDGMGRKDYGGEVLG
jgi:hypothetical protein